jgi:outer membrane protein
MSKSKFQILTISLVALATMFVSCAPSAEEAAKEEQTAKEEQNQTTFKIESGAVLPIAYVDMDSIIAKYNFAIDANDKLVNKYEDSQAKLNKKVKTFENDYKNFLHKEQNNAFMSRERYEKEKERLIKKEQELQELSTQLSQEYMMENQKLVQQFNDSIDNFLKVYNADGRYHLIFRNTATDNIMLAAEEYNITDEVVDGLNARYKK